MVGVMGFHSSIRQTGNRSRVAMPVLAAGLIAGCTTISEPPPAPIVPPQPLAPVYELGDILGATPGTIDQLLGEPGLVRTEGQGEYRRYALSDCSLIVILYPNANGALEASHVEATAKISGQDKPDLEACLAAG